MDNGINTDRKSTDAQIRASVKYNKSRANIMIRPTQDEGEAIKAAALRARQSVQAYVLQSVRERMEREKPAPAPTVKQESD